MILLLRLLIAHLIADFLLQPGAWVKDKNEKGIKSLKLFFHVLVVTALSVVFTLDYFSWQIPVLIFLFHYLIDLAKIYFMPHKVNQLVWFLLDQVVHILAIALVVAIVSEFLFDWSTIFSSLLSDQTSLVLFLAYLFVIWPTMIIVNLATKRWQNQIKEGLGPSLPDAGKMDWHIRTSTCINVCTDSTISSHRIFNCGQINSSNLGKKRGQCPIAFRVRVDWDFYQFYDCNFNRTVCQSHALSFSSN